MKILALASLFINTAVAAATDFTAAQLPGIRAAAERGSASAQNLLGMIYLKDQIVAGDDAQAAAWFRKAAEQGLARSQYNLEMMYRDGLGVVRDTAQTAVSLGKAAEPDNAQSRLDGALAQSQGIAQNDPQAAVTRLHETAEQAIGKLSEMFSMKVRYLLFWVILIGVLARWAWRYFHGEDRQVVDMTQAPIARETVQASLSGGMPDPGVSAWDRPLLNASSAVKNTPGDGSAAIAPGEINRRNWVAAFNAMPRRRMFWGLAVTGFFLVLVFSRSLPSRYGHMALIGFFFALFAAIFATVFTLLKNSDVYQMTVKALNSDAGIGRILGQPISTGLPMGSISISGSGGQANLAFKAQGPIGRGTVYVEAKKSLGQWKIDKAVLKAFKSKERVDFAK
jgi:hypothetical protein